jgi:DNA-binding NtrC family response regulator
MSARTASLRRLGRLLARARSPLFVLDGERRLVYGNSAFEELTGRSVEDLSGADPDDPPEEAPTAAALRALTPPAETRQGRPASAPALIVHPGGKRLEVRIEYRPLLAGSDRLVAILGLIHPETEPVPAIESPSHRLRSELATVLDRLRERIGDVAFVGSGPAYERLLVQVRAAAATTAPAWIVAEPGAGSRTLARAIHASGSNPRAPMIVLDVAALPAAAIESSLFAPAGAAESASLPPGSTVLLAAADGLGRDLQRRLVAELPRLTLTGLRLLASSAADPRLHRDADRLRVDFFYAMTGLILTLPPLRERLDELPLLAQHLLERANRGAARRRLGLTPAAIEVLRAHDWPGNLTELQRVIAAADARAEGELIDAPDLPASIRGEWACSFAPPAPAPPDLSLDATLETVERRLIERALQLARFNKSRAADRLGISRPRLYRRMQELGIADVTETSDSGG